MSGRMLKRTYAALAIVAGAGAVIAAVALASGGQPATVRAAIAAKLGTNVVVDAHGHTLYALSSESSHRILCKSADCVHNWPPLTVASRKAKLKAGAGVNGHLGLVRRANGAYQVTLGGKPLYRFAGDHGKAEDNGEGIPDFGGTWHAVTASGTPAGKPAPANTTPGSSPVPYATETAPPSAPTYPSTATTPSTPTTTPTTTTPTTTTPTTPTYTYPGY